MESIGESNATGAFGESCASAPAQTTAHPVLLQNFAIQWTS